DLAREVAAREAGQQQLADAALVVDAQLNELRSVVEEVAAALNSASMTRTELNQFLADELEAHPNFWSLGVAYDFWGTGVTYDYEPEDADAPNTTPYFNRPGGRVTLSPF